MISGHILAHVKRVNVAARSYPEPLAQLRQQPTAGFIQSVTPQLAHTGVRGSGEACQELNHLQKQIHSMTWPNVRVNA